MGETKPPFDPAADAGADRDPDATARRHRKWILAAILSVVAAYSTSEGPVRYARLCDWVPRQFGVWLYRPVETAFRLAGPMNELRSSYLAWWSDAGRRRAPWAVTVRILPNGQRTTVETYSGSSTMTATGTPPPSRAVAISAVADGHDVTVSYDRVMIDGEQVAILPAAWNEVSVRHSRGHYSVATK